ncbi:hypothetical protein [Noviherbaspirillum galbum]|uniref:Uncharacterized protein n=1 Tax=Noviherbaspirillum galbum TaxID=2709383 RepID=A0A6B3SHD9_9BURK|nr:hypothetical protein [Noviherbaspirillum galbum]NEX60070.1 hypothetical protein [Noviherbaspirillum galbum]
MANTYFDGTGILIFGANGGVTPIIAAIFAAYSVDSGFPVEQAMIYCEAEGSDTRWQSVKESLIAYAADQGIELADDAGLDAVLKAIGSKLGITDPAFAGFVERLSLEAGDGETDADLAPLFQLAQWFDDGHKLEGMRWEGAWHCDKMRLFQFGGVGYFCSNRVDVSEATSDISGFGLHLDAALAKGDRDAAAGILLTKTRRLLDSVTDETVRKELAAAVATGLLAPQPAVQMVVMPSQDQALLVHGDIIGTRDPDYGDPDLHDLADRLAKAMKTTVVHTAIDMPENHDWTWGAVIASLQDPVTA